MTRDEAVAHVRRLCPPGTLEALGRPSGGHALGRVAVETQSTRVDPRAEAEPLDEEPTKRERRPSSDQVAAVVRRPASGHFQAATRLLTEADAERVIGAEGPWKGPKP